MLLLLPLDTVPPVEYELLPPDEYDEPDDLPDEVAGKLLLRVAGAPYCTGAVLDTRAGAVPTLLPVVVVTVPGEALRVVTLPPAGAVTVLRVVL